MKSAYAARALVGALGCGALGLLILGGCGTTRQQRFERRIESTGEPALHGVYDQQLQTVMRELSLLEVDRLPVEMDAAGRRRARLREVSSLADSMAVAAAKIPDAIDDLDLTENGEIVFRRLAEKLGTQALELRKRATERDLEAAEATLDEISTTCTACHALFREAEPPFRQESKAGAGLVDPIGAAPIEWAWRVSRPTLRVSPSRSHSLSTHSARYARTTRRR